MLLYTLGRRKPFENVLQIGKWVRWRRTWQKDLARHGGRNAYFPISPRDFDALPAGRWRSYPGTACDERPNPSTIAGSLRGRTAADTATHWRHSLEPDRIPGGLAACFSWFWGGSDSIP